MSKIPQQLRCFPLDNNQQKYTPFYFVCQLAQVMVRASFVLRLSLQAFEPAYDILGKPLDIAIDIIFNTTAVQ